MAQEAKGDGLYQFVNFKNVRFTAWISRYLKLDISGLRYRKVSD